MGIYLRIKNLDRVFETAKTPPLLVNHFDIDTEEGRELLNAKIYSRFDGDVLDILPSCECKNLTSGYNVGLTCPICQTKCQPVTEREVESTLWLAPPAGVDTFINPQVWMILSDALTYDSKAVNLLEWLCSPTVVIPETSSAPWIKLKALGIGRGLNYFHENFDFIMETLFEHRLFKFKGAKAPRDELKIFLAMNRDRIFCKYLPVPSKLNFIMEGTVTSVYADTKMGPALEAIRTICAAENPMAPLTMKKRQAVAVNAMSYLADYYRNFNGVLLGKKEGWFRKHTYGSRLNYTFRCVITSLSDNHRYDEVIIPWSVAVMTLEIHITNKLLRLGYTPNECSKFINEHASVYHPLMDQIFQQLIAESPYGGIPVITQRNPTLARLSAQAMLITKVNPDPTINSMQLSVLCLAGPYLNKGPWPVMVMLTTSLMLESAKARSTTTGPVMAAVTVRKGLWIMAG
ncbi:MAG TPA: hypothetical protein VN081_01275 [Dongiaceae bacterium]|nr:hypothetical protein [Dongiaceae bacterium]